MPFAFDKTGYVPKHATLEVKPDPRNWALEAVQPPSTLPAFYKSDISTLPILMQAQQPSCVAHAVVYAMMYQIWKQTGKVVLLSPRFLYALCKQQDGIPNSDGTYLETALNIAKNVGVCEDSYFPNAVQLSSADYKDASKITHDARNNAALHRIPSYAFLTDLSRSGMNNGILQNGLIIVGQKIGSEWWEREDGTVSWAADDILPIRAPDAAHPVVSGHCTVEYAFGQYAHGLNEWSTEWGYQGRYWYGPSEQPEVYEAAVIGTFVKPTSPAPINSPQNTPQGSTDGLFHEVEQVVENVVEAVERVI